MTALNSYEFQCPQFVDFCAAIEGSPKNEIWFGQVSPTLRNETQSEFKAPQGVPKQKRNTKISTTIKNSPVFSKICSSNTTDSEKLNSRKVLSKRFSKSDGSVNIFPTLKQTVFKVSHKRSLSESDLRFKKKTYPTTPMCLKRTRHNAKSRKIKTTEELELEKIAQLQKQTFEHLRANEIAMKRLKLKQTCSMQKGLAGTEIKEKKLPVKNFQTDHNAIMEKVNAYATKVSSQAPKERVTTKESTIVHPERLKKISYLNKVGSRKTCRFLENLLNEVGPSQICDNSTAKEETNAVIKALTIKKSDAHSGLLFSASQRRTAFKPFNFQARTYDFGSKLIVKKENEISRKALLSSSMHTPQFNEKNKENISSMKLSYSVIKSETPRLGKTRNIVLKKN